MEQNIKWGDDAIPPEQESETELERLHRKNEQLAEEIKELRTENKRLEELATRDSLTGIFNRRGLEENFQYLIDERGKEKGNQRHEGKKRATTILLLDVDNFKIVNDAYGHKAGDQVLRDLSLHLEKLSRKTDMVCRWGGEEFVIAFRGADAQDIIDKFYDKNRGQAVVELETHIAGEPTTITLSGGVTELRPDETLDEAVDRADALLTAAKNAGKDHIEKEGEEK